MIENERKTIFEEGYIFLLDKPVFWTSFDLVNYVRVLLRRIIGISKIKVGHAGTLDPLANGLMIICTGKATRRVEEFTGMDKEYVAEITFGATTPSYDLETKINNQYQFTHITGKMLKKALMGFLGEQEQLPPAFSAKLVKGRRLYEYARKGSVKEVKPVKVVFREIELMNFKLPVVKVRIVCSKGTYIRSFANDLGKALGSGAYLSSLTRTAIGPYRLEQAMNTEELKDYLNQMKQNENFYV